MALFLLFFLAQLLSLGFSGSEHNLGCEIILFLFLFSKFDSQLLRLDAFSLCLRFLSSDAGGFLLSLNAEQFGLRFLGSLKLLF